jgi:peroxiredoxin
MPKFTIYAFLLFMWAAFSCRANPGEPVEAPSKILKDGISFLYYNRDYLKLSQDFTAYDENMHSITKGQFLKTYASGKYLPLRLNTGLSGNAYKLYKLTPSVSEDIKSTIANLGGIVYKHFLMEGKVLPGLSYTDINGKVYNRENTKGKIVVVKCWFLACHACNEEIPELNKMVDRYKNRKDVVFISLATDPKYTLAAFARKTTFKYALVPVKESYIQGDLKINIYPTHIIINKQGLIAKVVNAPGELEVALDHESSK